MSCFYHFFIFACLMWTTVLFNAETAIAQTQYAEVCRTELTRQVQGSFEYLIGKFKLTDALCEHDPKTALRNATEALRLADPHGPDAVVVAKLYITMISGLLEGRSIAELDSTDSDFVISSNAPNELRLHFYSTLIDREIWSRNFEPSLKPHLRGLVNLARASAGGCRDPHLKSRFESRELLVRTFWLSEPQTDPQVRALRERLQVSARIYPFLNNSAVIHLVDGAGQGELDFDQQVSHLHQAEKLVALSGNRFLIACCDYYLGVTYEQNKQYVDASKFFEKFLNEADELGALHFIFEAQQKLATVERRLGHSENALELFHLAEASPAFREQSIESQNHLYKTVLGLYLGLKNKNQIRKYKGKVLPASAISEIKRNRRQTDALKQTFSNIEQRAKDDQARLKEEHLVAAAESEAKIATLKLYLFFASAVSLLFASWIIYRARLNKVSNELDSEKINVRQSEQEREDLKLRLNRIQRMESLGLMAGSVAHDFNNILVGVLGNAEVIQMKNDLQDASFIKQRVANIITSAEKAASLSRQMLAYAGKQHIARQSTDLNRLVDQYAPVLKSACSANQHLEIQLCDFEIRSKVDPTQVEQVILNLVTNAVQASLGTGTISIKSGMESVVDVEQDSTLFGERTAGGEFCFIEVKDKGQGISPQDLERVFEPFYSNSEIGRGLGLSVVYGVVKSHDGLVRCQTEVGRGTVFRVLFPVAVEVVGRVDTEVDPASSDDFPTDCFDANSTRTVLVIDDEVSVLDLCKQLLELEGWNVITATDGTDGLVKVLELASEISCIVLDVVMPEMGANEVLREFEQRGINIPVVLMSGFSQTKLEFFLDRPNVVEIVEKPFHAVEFQRAVQKALVPLAVQPTPATVADPIVSLPGNAR